MVIHQRVLNWKACVCIVMSAHVEGHKRILLIFLKMMLATSKSFKSGEQVELLMAQPWVVGARNSWLRFHTCIGGCTEIGIGIPKDWMIGMDWMRGMRERKGSRTTSTILVREGMWTIVLFHPTRIHGWDNHILTFTERVTQDG